ncbi:hypothetical protein MTO96_000417 [Rhipicephalus appendiculatus]
MEKPARRRSASPGRPDRSAVAGPRGPTLCAGCSSAAISIRAGMQPAPRQLVALASHQEATKRHNDPLQSQQANGVHFLKTSMGTTLMGSAGGQPSIFSVAAGIAPSAASMQPQQLATLLSGQQFLGAPPQTFVQGHQASPVGVMVASRGTHTQLVNGPAGATAQVNSAQQIFLAPQPQSTQVLLPNPSPLSTGHLLGQLLPLGAGGSQQVVQVVAANGTVLTTTLANLPALSQQLSLAAALASASSNAASKQQATLTMPHHFQQVAPPQQQQQQQPHNGHGVWPMLGLMSALTNYTHPHSLG